MAVAFVASTSSGVNDQQGTSRAINVPAGAAAGHVALFLIEQWQSTATNPVMTWPAGFSEIVNYVSTTDGFQKVKVALKVLTGADSGSYTATWTGGTHWNQAQCVLVSGVNATTPLDVAVSLAQNGTGTPLPANSLTTVTAGCFLLYALANENSSSLSTTPTGYTKPANGEANYLKHAYKIAGAAGAETPSGGALSASTLKLGALIALRPAGGGATPVTATRATSWRVHSIVSSTRATTWRVRGSVSSSRATTWDALARVTAARATTWDTSLRVTSTRATTWRVRARVSGARATTWDTRVTVTGQRSSTWNLSSSLASVTSSRSTTWALDARVTAARATTWSVDARVTSARLATWDTRTRVSVARSTSWGTLARSTATRTTSWGVLAQTLAARLATWRTLAVVTASVSTSWDVEVVVGAYTPADTTTATVRPYFTIAVARLATATAVVRSPAATAQVRSTDEAG